MRRSFLLLLLVAIAVVVLGGAAFALRAGAADPPAAAAAQPSAPAASQEGDGPGLRQDGAADQEEGDNGDGGFGALRSAQARAYGECRREHGGGQAGKAACAELRPGPAHRHPAHPGRGPSDDEGREAPAGEPDDGDGGGFGALRSAQVRAYGECRREHGGGSAGKAACAELRPGPAHRHPAHPGRGPAGPKG